MFHLFYQFNHQVALRRSIDHQRSPSPVDYRCVSNALQHTWLNATRSQDLNVSFRVLSGLGGEMTKQLRRGLLVLRSSKQNPEVFSRKPSLYDSIL